MKDGKGIRPIVKSMTELLDEDSAVTKRELITLSRTYIQAANNGARDAVYKANEDILKGYKRLATLDNRTCLQCALCDGIEYGLHEEKPDLPCHPRCRCLYLPKTKSFRELGLNIDDLPEAERPWTIRKDGNIDMGGKKIENVGQIKGTFKDWWESLSDEDKARTAIGPTRKVLLEDGKISWDDLVDKHTGKAKLLEDIGFSTTGKPLKFQPGTLAKEVMANISLAEIPPEKMTKYLFSEESERGRNKGRVLAAALGLTKDDIEFFSNQLLDGLADSVVKSTSEGKYGETVSVLTKIVGRNGNTEVVVVKWMYHYDKFGKPRIPTLSTAYLPGKKKGKK